MRVKHFILVLLVISIVLCAFKAQASEIVQVPYSFLSFNKSDLDWWDSADDGCSGKTALPFSVTLEGRTYTYFAMNSDGYIQLLGDNDQPSNYGYGDIGELLYNDYEEDCELNNSYILAAYDDLSTQLNGFYGYKSYSDKIVFYYLTETYPDSGYELLNNFEIILFKNGAIRWNFNYANYEEWDYGLYTGLYLTDPERYFVEVLPTVTNQIPQSTSYLYGDPVPVPPSILLFGPGLTGLILVRRRKS